MKKSIAGFVSILMMVSLACGTSVDTQNESGEDVSVEESAAVEPTVEPSPEPEFTAFQIGDVIPVGDFEITVHGVEYPEGNEQTMPEEGFRYLMVDMSMLNTGSEPVEIRPLSTMTLQDGNGETYGTDLFAALDLYGRDLIDRLEVGEVIRGYVGFQVPLDSSGFVYVFEYGSSEDDQVYVDLGE